VYVPAYSWSSVGAPATAADEWAGDVLGPPALGFCFPFEAVLEHAAVAIITRAADIASVLATDNRGAIA
jgi:hypothetical protein